MSRLRGPGDIGLEVLNGKELGSQAGSSGGGPSAYGRGTGAGATLRATLGVWFILLLLGDLLLCRFEFSPVPGQQTQAVFICFRFPVGTPVTCHTMAPIKDTQDQ